MSPEELSEIYFDWLRTEAFSIREERRVYEGVVRSLHDIPFYWTIWSDENRAGDAISYRQFDFLGSLQDFAGFNQEWLNQWAMAAPSVLEVLLGMARRWAYYFEQPVSFFFDHLFKNMEFHLYPGRSLPVKSQEAIRNRVDDWLTRQFQSDGRGSPFPVDHQQVFDIVDMRGLDIWAQMNMYSAVHFQ